MAKKGKKKQNQSFDLDATRTLLITAAGDIIGRAITNFAQEGLHWLSPETRGGESGGLFHGDPAASLMRTLDDHGPTDLADLLDETGSSFSGLLHALRDAREFGLVDVDEDQRVALTAAGRRVAERLHKPAMSERAGRLLARVT